MPLGRMTVLVAGCCLLLTGGAVSADAPETRLASDGKALVPVVVADSAPGRVRDAGRTLAAYLGRIAGAKFEVVSGDGKSGIAVGRAED